MVELTEKGNEELSELCKIYKSNKGKDISQDEMADAMIQMGHYNLIGMWK